MCLTLFEALFENFVVDKVIVYLRFAVLSSFTYENFSARCVRAVQRP